VRSAHAIPSGLAAALHARFGAGMIQLADSPTEHPYMGESVAMSADGTTALVGAEGAGNQKGAAFVYHVASAGSWVSTSTPVATLAGTTSHGAGEKLGRNVALSADGTTAFVSAPHRLGGPSTLGAVLVFHVSDETAWASTSTPTAVLTVPGAFFFGDDGTAVSSDGTTLVVGDESSNAEAGGAWIFHVASESAWASTSTPTAALFNSNQPKSDRYAGYRVAISGSGTTVLVDNRGHGSEVGEAYIFHVASEGAWATNSTPTAILSNAGGAAYDSLGNTLALSADGATAFLASDANVGRGAVDVFHVADETSWVTSSAPAAILTNSGSAGGDYLGYSLAVSSDGTTVEASAPGAHKETGATYVFHVANANAWATTATPTAALTNSAGVHRDLRAFALAGSADGASLLVGSPFVNWSTGTADVFHVADAGSWLTSATPTATLTNSALPKPACVVPSLKGFPVGFALLFIDDANCRLGKVVKVHSTKKHKGRIVSQSPAPKTHLAPGSKINVKVGK
jgi:hypothetical protein